jgi:PAS domain S-box-containing protein
MAHDLEATADLLDESSALLLRAHRSEAIVESSDDAIISKTLTGVITSWNPAAERLFGYTAAEILGRPISILMPPERHDDMEVILSQIRKGERVDHFETVRVSKAGRRVPVSLSVSPVKDGAGRIVGAAKIARDISARTSAEAERERLLLEAHQGIRLREVFLSVAGHELRTPLNALKLQLYLLQRSLVGSSPLELVSKAQHEVDRLAALTNRLLDVSRIAAGGFTPDAASMDLVVLVADVVGSMRTDALQVGSVIEISAPASLVGEWDRAALDQVLTNLLSNAVKFGRGRPIGVTIEHQGTLARVIVRDQGPGVAPGDRERIFQQFERGVSDRSFGGLGLGLWIARQIVSAHGGRIGLMDRACPGAEFFVELPVRKEGALADPAGR